MSSYISCRCKLKFIMMDIPYDSGSVSYTHLDVYKRQPRDSQSTFEPQIIKKHQRDVSSIAGKVLAMYARGMSQRDIAATIEEDVYKRQGFPSTP